ncbi:GFA family protein [Paracoccus benzoatiresistens]|uniref:GFA family protein n=1 Tax=Paracoccus benzoatiresistens TaxID=2997341 RepID=A0ABT4J091_9RHOB|nr:GFA family protein [Paracoccus sp. EF6]MCZ0960042.1 GFA family protein [Paracoccus sp. EF6]
MSDFAGRCLCGAVTFKGTWAPEPVRACHCGQCRRWSGHVWAGAEATGLTIEGPVKWFRSSAEAERGFCPECGSSLFWHQLGATRHDVAPGAVDNPTGLRLAGHIFVADKGDYYDIADGLPQEPQG